ncbi:MULTISPECIES: hypothetical protein [Stenotrophomonas]|jgi:Na+/H+ antiporter NhaC|uniref:Transmembrane protein n=2 Tax=Stenotrophomonas TaxID=40323 RepID=A0A4S2CWS3_STEMA|nr:MULTISPECIES: hypothetical protein [Stenotrophomonas]MBD3825659.1 hypothetical protein [Stenotrophomonas sp.]QIO87845.1 hypothetical protein G9274_001530 [Stenotrophomonas rhizophila]TGY33025.1 hypothetical protein E5352_13920 [Stenotrophomonas maltophilia]HBS62429.1 hypothetical protein [Stenotrophomonas sp.]
MDFNLILPMLLIVCIVYTIKTIVDAATRRRIIEARGSEELVRSLLEGDANKRRLASLHWGCVLLLLALALGLIDVLGITEVTPGAIGLLLGATGVGNLVYYLLQRRIR